MTSTINRNVPATNAALVSKVVRDNFNAAANDIEALQQLIGGDVSGPASSVAGHIATFADASGKVIQDGGPPTGGNVVGPGSSVSGHVATFNGTTGQVIQDGGALAPVAFSGSASDLGTGTLPAARLPNPTAGTLGGVESIAATTHQFLTSISTSGVPAAAQPAATDISGLAASATTDTTNASNISSGTLGAGRLPATAIQTNVAAQMSGASLDGAAPVTLTDAAPTTWTMGTTNTFIWVLTGSHLLSNPTGGVSGGSGVIYINLGGFTATFDTNIKLVGTLPATGQTICGWFKNGSNVTIVVGGLTGF